MSEFDVDGTKVRFDDSWWAMKWDESAAYRSGLGKALQGTKAIDLIAVRNETLYFFELTDFVAHPIETKSQLVGGKLITEVVTKVRDSRNNDRLQARADCAREGSVTRGRVLGVLVSPETGRRASRE